MRHDIPKQESMSCYGWFIQNKNCSQRLAVNLSQLPKGGRVLELMSSEIAEKHCHYLLRSVRVQQECV